MHTFAQKPRVTQPTTSAKLAILRRSLSRESRDQSSTLDLQRTIGNQAVQQQLRARTPDMVGESTTAAPPLFGHDFSQIATHHGPRLEVDSDSRPPALQESWLQRQPKAGSRDSSQTEVLERPSSAAGTDGYEAKLVVQTFIPDEFVPGTGGLGYGDDRGFGKPGDSYRTFQQIVVQAEESLSEETSGGPAVAKTGISETVVPLVSGQASTDALHMSAKRKDPHSVDIHFKGSIRNGAQIVGSLSPAIDFTGAVRVTNSGGRPRYGFAISHDAFPAYEAFINGSPIYRWSYPAGSTVWDLIGSGTAVFDTRKTGDAPGGVIAPGKFEGFGGGGFGGGGAGGKY